MSFTYLPSGRVVYDTGKVLVGLRSPSNWRDQGASADAIQRALIANVSGAPAVKPEGKPLAWRISDFFRRFV